MPHSCPALQEANDNFGLARKKYHCFESEFTGVDTRVHIFQVPGGMISNLANQLQDRQALDRINEVYAEILRVRKESESPGYFAKYATLNLYGHGLDQFGSKFLVMGLQ